jgi:hypothetical protein
MSSDEVRRAEVRIRQIGQDVRRSADRALSAGSGHWCSTAATTFRRRLLAEVRRIHIVAAELDRAADALARHAVALERVSGRFDSGATDLGLGR